ncbi:hypothetical protein LTR02_006365 [Friedmanniomyces endolithicus]|nr:hypothetical protein LTR94_006192 [Friedmanniomyces endolithicus]KAK0777193.1 hypothetical protein LTR38_015243 [Friedmanniomyces endolithicus]KAK0788514.1 hypothetical protein LTR75_012586 [Friedmanniomyces endolithicus]KAK0796372.1 hypothetical protein LTR59_007125 [Friedmanniomyces endolithicus]KAK0850411.1 hypothetical protein LTR03_004641 [Friedmanniomyces endolithicus]
MDSIQHICNKLTAERAHHRQTLSTASLPPPYTPSDTIDAGNDSDSDNSDDEADDTPAPNKPTTMSSSPPPLTLTINAAHHIQGSNNLVPTSPSILADARNFGALLLAAVQQLNASAAEGGSI